MKGEFPLRAEKSIPGCVLVTAERMHWTMRESTAIALRDQLCELLPQSGVKREMDVIRKAMHEEKGGFGFAAA